MSRVVVGAVQAIAFKACDGGFMSNDVRIRQVMGDKLCDRSLGLRPSAALLVAAIFCGLVLACAPGAMASDIAVILNKDVNLQSVSTSDLIKICKGDMNHWPDGQALTLVILEPELPAMRVVNEKVYKLTAAEVRALFTGNNRVAANRHSMIMVGSAAELVRVVALKPGAIGMVDVYSINGTVSVLKVDEKLPLEPGYWLHAN